MVTELLLGASALVTSLIAAVVGFGGGMMLIALMPHFFAPSLVIPVHAVTQLASNTSRVWFSFDAVRWSLFTPFFLGSLAVRGRFLKKIHILSLAPYSRIINTVAYFCETQ